MAEWKKVILSGSNAELMSVTASAGIQAVLGTGTDNSVVVLNGTNNALVTDEIDSRVWGSTLVAATGTPVDNQIGVWTNANTQEGSSDLTFDGSVLSTLAIINDSSVAASHITGSFTGSFIGDGSNLTGLPSAAINTYTNASNNRIITSVDASSVNGEANLTFDGSTLGVTGAVTITSTLGVDGNTTLGNAAGDSVTINAATIDIPNVAAGTDNTVLIYNGSTILTDEIDARVWGSTLVDGAGAATRIAYWSDGDTLTSNAAITTDGTTLTVNGTTISDDVVVAGNLTVLGDTVQQNVANILVEDRFALFNSGSATGDGGIIVQTETNFTGVVLGWDDSATRWGIQKSTPLAQNATAIAPEAYVSAVVDVDGGLSDIAAFQQNGNIRVDGGEIYIYA